jgi:hypothetical protein
VSEYWAIKWIVADNWWVVKDARLGYVLPQKYKLRVRYKSKSEAKKEIRERYGSDRKFRIVHVRVNGGEKL